MKNYSKAFVLFLMVLNIAAPFAMAQQTNPPATGDGTGDALELKDAFTSGIGSNDKVKEGLGSIDQMFRIGGAIFALLCGALGAVALKDQEWGKALSYFVAAIVGLVFQWIIGSTQLL